MPNAANNYTPDLTGTYNANKISLLDAATMTIVLALPAPIPIGDTPVDLIVGFNIADTLQFRDDGGTCIAYILPPSLVFIE